MQDEGLDSRGTLKTTRKSNVHVLLRLILVQFANSVRSFVRPSSSFALASRPAAYRIGLLLAQAIVSVAKFSPKSNSSLDRVAQQS